MNGGRPKKREESKQSEALVLRVQVKEKASFQECAELAGNSLCGWVRERLRLAAIRELGVAGLKVQFVEDIAMQREGKENSSGEVVKNEVPGDQTMEQAEKSPEVLRKPKMVNPFES